MFFRFIGSDRILQRYTSVYQGKKTGWSFRDVFRHGQAPPLVDLRTLDLRLVFFLTLDPFLFAVFLDNRFARVFRNEAIPNIMFTNYYSIFPSPNSSPTTRLAFWQ